MRAEAKSRMNTLRRVSWFSLVAMMCTIQAPAQLTIGDNLKMKLNGSLGYGYSATFGDSNGGHGQNLVGNGTLSGSYYNPGFISFAGRPYWDRNQSNATSGMVTHDNGIDSSMSFFSGSPFPGAISFGKSFGNTSEFGLAGSAGIETHSSGQNFGVNWSELLQGLPPVYVTYSTSSGDFNALGSEGNNRSWSKDFATGTTYTYGGFNVQGTFNEGSSGYDYVDLLGASSNGSTDTTSYSFGAQHSLPLRGGMGINYSHSRYASHSASGTDGTTQNVSATTSFMPWTRFSFSGQAQYTTNLLAAISQQSLPQGGILLLTDHSDSHSLTYGGSASFNIGHGWTTNANVNRNMVSFSGHDYESTQFGASVGYHFTHRLFGLFHFNVGLIDRANKEGNTGAALVGSIGMDRPFGRWDTSADFSYSQDVQTLYGMATTSNYSYGGSLRRKINHETYWAGTVRMAHSGLSQQAGSSSASESMTSSLIWKRYNFSGGYSQSQGTSVLSAAGVLTPVSGAGLITNDFLYFNGHSISASVSTRLFRRVNVGGTYTRSHSDLQSPTKNSYAESQTYNSHFDWRLRKMTLTGGFARVQQQASVVKSGPYVVNSVYLSFSRWFNVF